MKNLSISILITLVIITFLGSCKKKEKEPITPAETSGSMIVKFEHTFDGHEFELNSAYYFKNSNEDSLKFTKLLYNISNIKLKKTDGTIWEQPTSYYLINYANAVAGICEFKIEGVPTGDYTEITYTIGVDSAANVSGAQTGALDPTNGMFWTWNTGYIFVKIEGSYKNVSSGSFAYHIGGFKNATSTNAIQTNVFSFGSTPATVNPNATPQIHLSVDLYNFFSGTGMTLQVPSIPTCMMPGTNAVNLSKNYVDMFTLEHVHN